MRDTFLLLWVGFLVIGVIGSIISSIRKQMQQQQAVRPAARRVTLDASTTLRAGSVERRPPSVTPQAEPRKTPRRTPVVPPAPPQPPLPSYAELVQPDAGSRSSIPRFLRGRKAIVQGIVAAEVLGKPRALGDEYP
jgi:hypothetical protein